MNPKLNKILVISLILLIIFGIAIRLFSLQKDITSDETDFVKAAKAIQETGHPLFYHSEQQPSELALWHPPMYIYLLSLALNSSFPEISARSINAIFSVFTAVLIFLFCINLIDSRHKKIIGLSAAALFLINYFILSSSVLIDIDVLSMFFMLAFIFFILMDFKKQNPWYFALAAASLFFGIFNRYPIAFLVFVALGVYYLINKDLRKSFMRYFLVGLLAGIAFLLVWGFYSTFMEPGTFFSFIIHNAALGSENLSSIGTYIGSFMLNISQLIRLFTLPAIILMLLSFSYFLRRKEKPIKILLIYSLSILLLFTFISRPAFGYPRYFLTMFPAIIILISLFVYENLKGQAIDKKMFLLAVISFAISLCLLIILHPQSTFYESNGLIKATNLPDFIFNLFASFPLFFAFFFRDKRKIAAIFILLALVLSYSLYFDLVFVNHESNIKEAGTYLKEHTNASDVIICPKAVGYYAERKFWVNDFTKPPMNNLSAQFLFAYFKKSLENRNMNDEFFWEKGYFGGINPPQPTQETLNSAKYVVLYHPVDARVPENTIGDFYIYRLND